MDSNSNSTSGSTDANPSSNLSTLSAQSNKRHTVGGFLSPHPQSRGRKTHRLPGNEEPQDESQVESQTAASSTATASNDTSAGEKPVPYRSTSHGKHTDGGFVIEHASYGSEGDITGILIDEARQEMIIEEAMKKKAEEEASRAASSNSPGSEGK